MQTDALALMKIASDMLEREFEPIMDAIETEEEMNEVLERIKARFAHQHR